MFLGSLPLVNITSCVPAKMKASSKFGISISTMMSLDRNLQKQEGV